MKAGELPPDKKHFRVDEAADALATSTRSIYRMIQYGELVRVKRRGKRVIPRSELERILNVDAYDEED
ncbi:MAG: helix-turn-helix domain-containing protein [bacterium]